MLNLFGDEFCFHLTFRIKIVSHQFHIHVVSIFLYVEEKVTRKKVKEKDRGDRFMIVVPDTRCAVRLLSSSDEIDAP